ncbi:MAG: ankyrin repeat domain-containing protein [Candidatus Babeliales bacterium]
MNTIYRFYLLVLSASMSMSVGAAEVEQKEKKEKTAATSFYKPRRRSTGRTRHDVKRKTKKPSPVVVGPRTEVGDNPEEIRLEQEEDTPIMHTIMKAVEAMQRKNPEEHKKYVAEVGKMFQQGVKIGAQNKFRETPLMRAAEYGDLRICELLVSYSKGKRINAHNVQGDTALMYATRGGHVPVVEFLLSRGASLHMSNNEMQTVLMMASRRNDSKIIQVILDNLTQEAKEKRISLVSFELKQENAHGDTALQIAMQSHAREAEELLLKVSGKVDYEALQLINAAKIGDVKKVKALLAHKVNVNYQYVNQTPIIAAVMCEVPQAMLAIVTELLAAGAEPNVLNRFGSTPLALVASAHFDSNWKFRMHDAPQFSAVQCQIIEVLLTKADINGVVGGAQSRSIPLIAAISNYNLVVAQFLIDRGADICVRSHGKSVAIYVQEMIDEFRGRNELLFNEWITLLFDVDIGCDPIAKTPAAALFKAINHGDVKRVAELLARDPQPDVEATFNNITPLTLAIEHNNAAIIQALIKAGVDVNRENEQGVTPLMLAAELGFLAPVLALLDAPEIQVNTFDSNMNTALIFFASSELQNEESIQLLKALLRQRALVRVRNGQGKSALDIVRDNAEANPAIQEQVIKILEEAEEKEKKVRSFGF